MIQRRTRLLSARYAQKAITFHMEFSPEAVQNSRYEMQTLYSMKNLQLASEATDRI